MLQEQQSLGGSDNVAVPHSNCWGCSAAAVAAAQHIHNRHFANIRSLLLVPAATACQQCKQLARQSFDAVPISHCLLDANATLNATCISCAAASAAATACAAYVSCTIRSYGARTETSGTVEVSFDAEAVAGRHCLMVDDLCDSGLTLLTVSMRPHQLLQPTVRMRLVPSCCRCCSAALAAAAAAAL